MKYKVGLLALAGMLLTASTGFAAIQYYTLQNEKGETVYEEKNAQDFPERPQVTEEEYKRVHISNKVWTDEIGPGEAAAIYVVPHNPDRKIDIRANPLDVNNLADLRSMIKDPSVTIPDELTGSYTFETGSIQMFMQNDITPLTEEERTTIAKQLHEEAVASGKDYATMPVPLADTFWRVTSTYKKGDLGVDLRVVNLGPDGTLTTYWNDETQVTKKKLNINQVEVIQTNWLSSNSVSLDWVAELPDGTRHAYTLATLDQQVTEDELIQIAEAYIRK